MKKIIAMLAAVVLTMSCMTACKDSSKDEKDTSSKETTTAAKEESKADESSEEESEAEPESEADEESEAEEESKADAQPAGNDELSDDIYSFEVSIDGTKLSFPMYYADFIELGWKMDGDDTTKVDPNQYLISQVFKKDDVKVYAPILNLDEDVLPASECLIGGIVIDYTYLKECDKEIVLPGNIEFNKSTMDEAKAAYGDPSSVYEGSSYTKCMYNLQSYSSVELYFDIESNVLNKIDIRNFDDSNLSDDKKPKSDNDKKKAEINVDYTAPKDIGENFSDFIVKIDGDLFSVPAPVSEFVDKGWKIITADSDETVKAKNYGRVSLQKNNQTMRVSVMNYSESAADIEDCFVTSVKAGRNSTDLPIEIQKGIKIGTSKADVEKAIKDEEYETEETSLYDYYDIRSSGSSAHVEIYVYKDDGKVGVISVNNQPKYKDFVNN